MEIKNLKKAAQRIKKAIENKEKIILYGDADLDGTTSVVILKETIKNLGGKIAAVYFPDREKEGYGITETGLNYLKDFSPALLIALDLGIGNFEEVNLAKKMGFEVIIIDHHEILNGLPKAEIIIDPKQKDDKSSLEYLATAGIIYKLAELLFSQKMNQHLRENLLELVALGTIADMMPREGENKVMITEGLESLKSTWRPGLEVFFEEGVLNNQKNVFEKASKVISLLNVRDIENQLPVSYRLLTANSKPEAKEILQKLKEKDLERKRKKIEITKQVEQTISGKDDPIILEGDSSWDLILLGSIASVVSQKYKKPTFLFKKSKKKSIGSARTSVETDLVQAMKSCSELLKTFGGHPRAAGFTIKNENLEEFKKCLIKYFK